MKTPIGCLVLCASGFGQTMEVVVVNAATHAPVSGAQVLYTSVMNGRSPLVTDSAGRLQVPAAKGYCYFQVSRGGFLDATTTVLVMAGETSPARVEIALTGQSVIAGKIQDEDGFPVKGAQIQALRYQMVQGKRELHPVTGALSQANDLGEYRIAKLPAGSYYVRAWSAALHKWDSRYGIEYYGGATEPSTHYTINVKPGQERRGIDFHLTRHAELTVTGRLQWPDGVPRPKSVSLSVSSEFADPMTVRPDEQGEFVIRHVQPDSRLTAAVHPPLRPGNVIAEQTIQVGHSNLDHVVIAARVVTPADIAGTLVTDAGSRQRLSVRLRAVYASDTVTAEVAQDGSFVLKGVLPQRYSLSVTAVPQPPAPTMMPPLVTSACLGDRDVSNGALNFTTPPEGPLRLVTTWKFVNLAGKLVDGSGRGISGRYVGFSPAGKDASPNNWRATTGWDGSFKLSSLPGTYFVYVGSDLETLNDPDYLDAHRSDFRTVRVMSGKNPPLILDQAASLGRIWRRLRNTIETHRSARDKSAASLPATCSGGSQPPSH
jgi:hypothetical protein